MEPLYRRQHRLSPADSDEPAAERPPPRPPFRGPSLLNDAGLDEILALIVVVAAALLLCVRLMLESSNREQVERKVAVLLSKEAVPDAKKKKIKTPP